jgi:hypothetical protein
MAFSIAGPLKILRCRAQLDKQISRTNPFASRLIHCVNEFNNPVVQQWHPRLDGCHHARAILDMQQHGQLALHDL